MSLLNGNPALELISSFTVAFFIGRTEENDWDDITLMKRIENVRAFIKKIMGVFVKSEGLVNCSSL